jgi:two-component system sensor histidine kinase BarA
MRVLVVEDHNIAIMVVKVILEKYGCVVDTIGEGEAALKLVQEVAYDLILMDIGLPGADGYEVTRWIRAHEETMDCRIPIVGLTGHISSEKRQYGQEVGMDFILTKPLTYESAAQLLRDLGWERLLGTEILGS